LLSARRTRLRAADPIARELWLECAHGFGRKRAARDEGSRPGFTTAAGGCAWYLAQTAVRLEEAARSNEGNAVRAADGFQSVNAAVIGIRHARE
jgi:hypothetical protein